MIILNPRLENLNCAMRICTFINCINLRFTIFALVSSGVCDLVRACRAVTYFQINLEEYEPYTEILVLTTNFLRNKIKTVFVQYDCTYIQTANDIRESYNINKSFGIFSM